MYETIMELILDANKNNKMDDITAMQLIQAIHNFSILAIAEKIDISEKLNKINSITAMSIATGNKIIK